MNKAPNFGTYSLCALWLAIAYFFWHELGPEAYMGVAEHRAATGALAIFYLAIFVAHATSALYRLRAPARALLMSALRPNLSPTQRS